MSAPTAPIQLQRHKVSFELKNAQQQDLEGLAEAREHMHGAFEAFRIEKKNRDAEMHQEHLANLAKLERDQAGEEAKRAEVARFEKAYNQTRGLDTDHLKRHLAAAWKEKANPVKKELRFGVDGSLFVRASRTPNSKKYDEHHVGKLWYDDDRFVKASDAGGGLREIYRRRGKFEGKTRAGDYVEDAAGTKINRYLLRNLSDHDSGTIFGANHRGLAARNQRMPGNPDGGEVAKHILHHLRGTKKSDGSGDYEPRHFISATSTRKDIFGSTGGNFYSPTKGRALIDAARIPKDDLFDVHRQQSVERWITGRPQSWNDSYRGEDKSKNLAARDTVRTREILIHGQIPERSIIDKWKWTGKPGEANANVTGKYRMKWHDEADDHWYEY